MATNKRGWHIPTVTLPRIRFGSRQKREDNPALAYYLAIVPTLLLSIFGLIMGFSAQAVTATAQGENPYTVYARPLIIILVSLVIATIVLLVPRRRLTHLAPVMLVGTLGFQSLVFSPLGRSEGGNANWMEAGPIMAQPSEFLKLALIVFLAFMVSKSTSKRGGWKAISLVVGLPILTTPGAVALDRGMGTATATAVDALGTVQVAGLPKRWFGGLVVLAVPTMVLLVLSNPMHIRHILAILPGASKRPNESAPEQIDRSLWVLDSGDLTGLGSGASREKWDYLQAAHTDFIFAVIDKEFGLLGILDVLLCLGLLTWGMFRTACRSSDLLATIVPSGAASRVGIQAVISVLSVMGLGPVISVLLPLVSYGGSSFLFTITAIAVVASFARARAGIWMTSRPDEASAGRDPRLAPRRHSAR